MNTHKPKIPTKIISLILIHVFLAVNLVYPSSLPHNKYLNHSVSSLNIAYISNRTIGNKLRLPVGKGVDRTGAALENWRRKRAIAALENSKRRLYSEFWLDYWTEQSKELSSAITLTPKMEAYAALLLEPAVYGMWGNVPRPFTGFQQLIQAVISKHGTVNTDVEQFSGDMKQAIIEGLTLLAQGLYLKMGIDIDDCNSRQMGVLFRPLIAHFVEEQFKIKERNGHRIIYIAGKPLITDGGINDSSLGNIIKIFRLRLFNQVLKKQPEALSAFGIGTYFMEAKNISWASENILWLHLIEVISRLRNHNTSNLEILNLLEAMWSNDGFLDKNRFLKRLKQKNKKLLAEEKANPAVNLFKPTLEDTFGIGTIEKIGEAAIGNGDWLRRISKHPSVVEKADITGFDLENPKHQAVDPKNWEGLRIVHNFDEMPYGLALFHEAFADYNLMNDSNRLSQYDEHFSPGAWFLFAHIFYQGSLVPQPQYCLFVWLETRGYDYQVYTIDSLPKDYPVTYWWNKLAIDKANYLIVAKKPVSENIGLTSNALGHRVSGRDL
ncbi:MAG: hypothetical protein Q8O13_10985 [Candidatus Omnitrophota bacterium]|nr:hypothetical protein [Candidatus Omnitrophota bacterium]